MSQKASLFNPENIKGIYQLLAAFLLIVEASLGYWLIQSGDRTEKIIAGGLITLIFIVFLFIALKIAQTTYAKKTLTSEGVGEIKPAQSSIKEEEIQEQNKGIIVGPDKSYILQKPSKNWHVSEMSYNEWIGQGLGINDQDYIEKVINKKHIQGEILVIHSDKEGYLTPIPGKTLVDGLKIPTALHIPVFMRLSILPMERRQSPLYFERPLLHNYNLFISGMIGQGVLTLIDQERISDKQGIQKMISIFRQKLTDIRYQGKDFNEISIYFSPIGIQGKTKDHVLILQYVNTSANDAHLNADLQELKDVINSFKPIEVLNVEKELAKQKKYADEKLNIFIEQNKTNIFFKEFGMAVLKLKGLDLEIVEDRQFAIHLLQPFRDMTEYLGLKFDNTDKLFEALSDAEKGDATKLKEVVPAMLNDLENIDLHNGDAKPD